MHETRDSIAEVWGPRTPQSDGWQVRVDERTLEDPDHWVQAACVLCSNASSMARAMPIATPATPTA